MNTYIIVFLGAALIASVIMPGIIVFARKLNAYDSVNARKVHVRAIPRIGGIAIVLAMLLAVIPVLLMNNSIGEAYRQNIVQVITLVSAAMAVFLIGLLDDICHLSARTKFATQLLAAALLCSVNITIEQITLTDSLVINLGILSCPITILWIVGVTNAMNMIDGLDGLAGGIAMIAASVIVILAIISHQVIIAVMMIALLGSLLGFMFYNVNPAKIFMGDCGSNFLGFILASASVLTATKAATLTAIALPALALGVPIIDTFFSMLRRFMQRRSMFSPDQGHVHHRLLELGLKHKHVVLFLHLITVCVSLIGMLMLITRNEASIAILILAVSVLIFVFRFTGAFHVGSILCDFHKKRNIASEQKQYKKRYEKTRLEFKHVQDLPQWWAAMKAAAQEMDCAWMTLPMLTPDGCAETMHWSNSNQSVHASKTVEFSLPLHHDLDYQDSHMKLTVSMAISHSFESASLRASFLSRLIDEHDVYEIMTQNISKPDRVQSFKEKHRRLRQLITSAWSDIPEQQNVVASSQPVNYRPCGDLL